MIPVLSTLVSVGVQGGAPLTYDITLGLLQDRLGVTALTLRFLFVNGDPGRMNLWI